MKCLCDGTDSSERADRMHERPDDGSLRYGGRKSDKLVRCYPKKELGTYRVEVELHSGLLGRLGITDGQDVGDAARAIHPKHVSFADLDWKKLQLYLARTKIPNQQSILKGALKRATSIRRVTRYLGRRGIPNVYRFLVPLKINKTVEHALEKWALQFEEDWHRLN